MPSIGLSPLCPFTLVVMNSKRKRERRFCVGDEKERARKVKPTEWTARIRAVLMGFRPLGGGRDAPRASSISSSFVPSNLKGGGRAIGQFIFNDRRKKDQNVCTACMYN